jgi:guanylate kinase
MLKGVLALKRNHLPAFFVLVVPSNLEELRKRLQLRGESPENIELRCAQMVRELQYKDVPGFYNAVIINDNVDEAYQQLENAVKEIIIKFPNLKETSS